MILAYSIIQTIISIPFNQRKKYFALTPYTFYSIDTDYVRVLTVTRASLILVISLRYIRNMYKEDIPISLSFI